MTFLDFFFFGELCKGGPCSKSWNEKSVNGPAPIKSGPNRNRFHMQDSSWENIVPS